MRTWLMRWAIFRFFLQPSLLRSLIGWIWVVVTLGAIFESVVYIRPFFDDTNGELAQDLYIPANALARVARHDLAPDRIALFADDVQLLVRTMTEIQTPREEFTFQVWSADGRLLLKDPAHPQLPNMPPHAIATKKISKVNGWRYNAAWSPDQRIWAVAGKSDLYYQRIFVILGLGIVGSFIIYYTVTLLALWFAIRMGLRPLQKISRRIVTRQVDDPSPIAHPETDPRELTPLIAALDNYAARLAQLKDAERRFFADAAHELRTPLGVLSAQAYALSQADDAETRQSLTQALQRGAQRSAEVLSKVLTLARLDSLERAQQMRLIDLQDWLQNCIAEHAPRAIAAGIDIGLAEETANLSVPALPELLSTAIDNLIDNALRYIPAGSQIAVSFGYDSSKVWIRVADTGPGIPVADRHRIFLRFERGSEVGSQAGSGLGLAIAAEIAKLHGGTLKLEESAVGASFLFIWPLVQAAH